MKAVVSIIMTEYIRLWKLYCMSATFTEYIDYESCIVYVSYRLWKFYCMSVTFTEYIDYEGTVNLCD